MTPTIAHQGAWVDPRFPGQGLIVFGKSYFFFGQNVDDDSERWWSGNRHADGTYSFDTMCDPHSKLAKENYPDKPLHSIVSAGLARIDAVGDKLVWNALSMEHRPYWQAEYGRLSFDLSPLLLSDNPLCGPWRVPGVEDEGYTAIITDTFCAMHFFGHRPRPLRNDPRWYSDENQGQRWIQYTGERIGDTCTLTETRVRHAQFMKRGDQVTVPAYDPENPKCQEFPTGSATLEIGPDSLTLKDVALERV